jgi:hypothetical protein
MGARRKEGLKAYENEKNPTLKVGPLRVIDTTFGGHQKANNALILLKLQWWRRRESNPTHFNTIMGRKRGVFTHFYKFVDCAETPMIQGVLSS